MIATKSREPVTAESHKSMDPVVTEFVDLGKGQYIRRTFQLQTNPRLFFINAFYAASVTLVVLIALLIGFRFGLFLLIFVIGLFSLLRSYVEPKFVRGTLVRDETVFIKQDHLKSPKV